MVDSIGVRISSEDFYPVWKPADEKTRRVVLSPSPNPDGYTLAFYRSLNEDDTELAEIATLVFEGEVRQWEILISRDRENKLYLWAKSDAGEEQKAELDFADLPTLSLWHRTLPASDPAVSLDDNAFSDYEALLPEFFADDSVLNTEFADAPADPAPSDAEDKSLDDSFLESILDEYLKEDHPESAQESLISEEIESPFFDVTPEDEQQFPSLEDLELNAESVEDLIAQTEEPLIEDKYFGELALEDKDSEELAIEDQSPEILLEDFSDLGLETQNLGELSTEITSGLPAESEELEMLESFEEPILSFEPDVAQQEERAEETLESPETPSDEDLEVDSTTPRAEELAGLEDLLEPSSPEEETEEDNTEPSLPLAETLELETPAEPEEADEVFPEEEEYEFSSTTLDSMDAVEELKDLDDLSELFDSKEEDKAEEISEPEESTEPPEAEEILETEEDIPAEESEEINLDFLNLPKVEVEEPELLALPLDEDSFQDFLAGLGEESLFAPDEPVKEESFEDALPWQLKEEDDLPAKTQEETLDALLELDLEIATETEAEEKHEDIPEDSFKAEILEAFPAETSEESNLPEEQDSLGISAFEFPLTDEESKDFTEEVAGLELPWQLDAPKEVTEELFEAGANEEASFDFLAQVTDEDIVSELPADFDMDADFNLESLLSDEPVAKEDEDAEELEALPSFNSFEESETEESSSPLAEFTPETQEESPVNAFSFLDEEDAPVKPETEEAGSAYNWGDLEEGDQNFLETLAGEGMESVLPYETLQEDHLDADIQTAMRETVKSFEEEKEEEEPLRSSLFTATLVAVAVFTFIVGTLFFYQSMTGLERPLLRQQNLDLRQNTRFQQSQESWRNPEVEKEIERFKGSLSSFEKAFKSENK